MSDIYYHFSSYTFRDFRQDDGMWCCEIVDGVGKPIDGFPKFYSRYSLWAKAHAMQYYADELYKLKQTSTPVD